MQDLRLVILIISGLAIMALLLHGLWISKRDNKSKFERQGLDLDSEASFENQAFEDENQESLAHSDDYEIIRKSPMKLDPLITDYDSENNQDDVEHHAEPFNYGHHRTLNHESRQTEQALEQQKAQGHQHAPLFSTSEENLADETKEKIEAETEASEESADLDVIVLHVHAGISEEFKGNKLFDSMTRNDLRFGEMDIFHRHINESEKVIFSVADMMKPGVFKLDDIDNFTTQGLSFFMTLPCYGEADQNFKLMLKTAQQIADDLGGNVLDDARNLMTPNRLDAYRRQIKEFKEKQQA